MNDQATMAVLVVLAVHPKLYNYFIPFVERTAACEYINIQKTNGLQDV